MDKTQTRAAGWINRSLFGAAYTLLMFHNLLVSFSTIDIPLWLQVLMLGVATILIASFLIRARTLNTRALRSSFLFLAVGTAVFLSTGKLDFIYLAVLLFLTHCIQERDFLRIDMRNRIILVLGLLFLSKTGLIEDTILGKHGVANGNVFVRGGGFNNPNSLGMMFCLIFLEALLLLNKTKKSALKAVLIYFMMAVGAVFLSGTRTAVALMTVAVVLYLMYDRGFFRPGGWMCFGKWTAIGLFVLSVAFCLWYRRGGQLIRIINSVLTGRLALCSSFMNRYSVTLFGNAVDYYSGARALAMGLPAVVCDNVYIYLLYNLGGAAFGLWITLITKTAAYLLQRDKVLEFLMLAVVLLYGSMENTIANIMFFPFVVYASKTLVRNKRCKYDTEKQTDQSPPVTLSDGL